jgi:hypothetical protein
MMEILQWLDASTIVRTLTYAAILSLLFFLLTAALEKSRRLRIYEKKSHLELDLLRAKLESEVYRKNKSLTSDPVNFEDVNHLVIDSVGSEAHKNIKESDLIKNSEFLKSIGVDAPKIEQKSGQVFVLTPHHSEFDRTYKTIKDVSSGLNLTISRGDETYTESSILKHILEKILEAEIIFANIDGRNPNVFYELGIAQTLGKPVFLLTSEITSVPFDVANQRMIVWDTEETLRMGLTRALALYGLGQKGSAQ